VINTWLMSRALPESC